jgi:hypothetical protein
LKNKVQHPRGCRTAGLRSEQLLRRQISRQRVRVKRPWRDSISAIDTVVERAGSKRE